MSNDRKIVNYPILLGEYFDFPCKIESHKEYVTTHQTPIIDGYGHDHEAEFKECKECKDKYERAVYIFDGVTATREKRSNKK